MKAGHYILAAAASLVVAFWPDGANAALAPRDAHTAARRWLASHPRPFGGRACGRPSGDVLTAAIGGTNLFHSVGFAGGGFAVFAASGDGAAPLAFSTSGTFCETNAAPLWAMLLADSGAFRARRNRGARPRLLASSPVPNLPEGVTVFRTTTPSMRLTADSPKNPIESQEYLDDLRVAPLVKSTWDQGGGIFNSCTPSNSLCGCVATAMAQIMRCHEWPAGNVTARTNTCSYGCTSEETPTPESKKLVLPMYGGFYDWAAMPLTPDSFTITDAQRQAIGVLLSDVGISVHMNYYYNQAVSAAYSAMAALAFTNVWGYAQVQYWDNFDNAHDYKVGDPTDGYLPTATFENSILSNLDAGYPCLLGIDDNNYNGHAIVVDGYGYSDARRYVHLNMGWSGASDYWYMFPVKGYAYLTDIVYNLFPTNTGNIVSGRVTDASGSTVGGVRVRAYDSSSNIVATAYTSSTGIYALIVPNKPLSLTVIAACAGGFAITNTITSTSCSYCFAEALVEADPLGWGYLDETIAPSVGNRWGVNLTLEPRPHFIIRVR